MSLGLSIGGARRTHSYVGETSGGLSGEVEKARKADIAPVEVRVTATLGTDGSYALTVEAMGQSTTASNVSPDGLADRLARLIQVVSKAAARGDLTKSRQRDSSPLGLGLGAPVSNRKSLRFTS